MDQQDRPNILFTRLSASPRSSPSWTPEPAMLGKSHRPSLCPLAALRLSQRDLVKALLLGKNFGASVLPSLASRPSQPGTKKAPPIPRCAPWRTCIGVNCDGLRLRKALGFFPVRFRRSGSSSVKSTLAADRGCAIRFGLRQCARGAKSNASGEHHQHRDLQP